MGLFDDSMAQAVASYFGTSTDQLKQDLKDQGSLQGVAKKYQKDTTEGKAGLETALENALRQQLKDRGVAQAQVDQMADAFKQNFDRLYTMTPGQGGPGGLPGMPGGPRGPRGPQPSAAPTN